MPQPGYASPATVTNHSPRAIADLGPGDHLCCIYETEEEHRSVVTPFLRQGLEQGEKAIYIVDTRTAGTILGYLRDDGLDVESHLARGQLAVLTRDQAYMREGVFDPEGMIALLREETEQALAEGYPALRVTGEMTWALRGLPGSERLIEYEARLNEFFPGSQCLAICQYDRRRFDPAVLLEVLRTHPIAIIGTQVYDNCYYIPPVELLSDDPAAAELRYWVHNLAERRRAEEKIRGLARFPSENSNPVLRVRKDGTILYANDASAVLLDTWGRQVGQRLPDLWHRSAPGAVDSRLARTAEVNAGGRVFALTFAPVVEQEYANVYGLDITERKRAEDALQQYAERIGTLREIDQALLATYSVEEIAEAALHHVRQLVPYQRASVAVFDFEAGEMSLLAVSSDGGSRLGKGWRGSLERAWFVKGLCQGQAHAVEDLLALPPSSSLIRALQAEGVRSYVNLSIIAQGKLIGSLNLGMDRPGKLDPEHVDVALEVADQLAIGIQQARLYEEVRRHADELERRVAVRTTELRTSQARLRAIFDGTAIGIALVDMEGRLMESNPALQEMLGYSGKELCGMVFTDFTHPDDAMTDGNLHRELVAGKRDRYKTENRYIRKDGRKVWASLTVSLVRGASEEPRFAIGMVEDITEQKQIQAALLQAEKLAIAGKLAASLAHEINNPLQSVIGCLGLAKETLAEGGDVSRYLQVALEELRRVARIVAQLRDLNRPPRPEKKEPTDVNELLEGVLVLSRKQCENRQVEVVWKAAADLPLLLLARDQVQQVFLNLLLNALDAMPAGGRLQVSTTRTGQPAGVRIAFTDSGVGIPPDTLPHVFDPFYSTKPEGLGLGLPISHDIVKQHGGRIEMNSQVGEGTTVTVWLPA
jgi:PAS domain S-box-containing protein